MQGVPLGRTEPRRRLPTSPGASMQTLFARTAVQIASSTFPRSASPAIDLRWLREALLESACEAGGVLVAYGGRDLLYSHTRARKEHSGLLESLLGQYVTQAYAGCLLEQVLQTRLAQVQPGGEIGDPPKRGRFDHLQDLANAKFRGGTGNPPIPSVRTRHIDHASLP